MDVNHPFVWLKVEWGERLVMNIECDEFELLHRDRCVANGAGTQHSTLLTQGRPAAIES